MYVAPAAVIGCARMRRRPRAGEGGVGMTKGSGCACKQSGDRDSVEAGFDMPGRCVPSCSPWPRTT